MQPSLDLSELNPLKEAVVLAPHPDDELFAIDAIRQLKKQDYKVSIYYFHTPWRRRCEALNATNYLKCSFLEFSNPKYVLQDGKFHLYIDIIFREIKAILPKFSIVLCPALEGGHQDHDTVSLTCKILSSRHTFANHKFYYYSCYNAYSKFGIFNVGIPSQYYPNYRRHDIPCSASVHELLYLMFVVYKSQFKSWIVLGPIMLLLRLATVRCILSNISKVDSNSYNHIFSGIDNPRPLYEIHRRITHDEWLRHTRITLNL